jgi:hypothetical protein
MERMADAANSLTGQVAARLLAEKRSRDEAEAKRMGLIEQLRIEQELDDNPDEILSWDDPRIHSKIPLNPEYF